MQIRSLKKKLAKEAALGLAGLAVLGAITAFFDDYNTSYGNETNEMKNKVESLSREARQLQEKFLKVQKNADLYAEYQRQSEQGGMTAERSLVATRLSEAAAKYFIFNAGNDKISISKPEETNDEKFKRPSASVVSAEVAVPFEALTDEDVYAFVRTLAEELPGIVRFKKFSVKRETRITDQVISTVAKEGKYKIVSGEIVFAISGIKPTTPNATPNATVPNANP